MDYHEFLLESHDCHTSSLVKDLHNTKFFADVTIVCQDDFKLKAHKFILSFYSEVFELTLKMVNDIVNIPQVRQEEMLLILQFMYIGKVEVPKKTIVEFSQAVRELKVKYINDETLNELLEEHLSKVKAKELLEEQVKGLKVIKMLEDQVKEGKVQELLEKQNKHVEKKKSKKGKRGPGWSPSWSCKECDLPFHREASYSCHMETVHHKTKWKCLDCDTTFKSQAAINYHRDSVHNQLKHPCPQCSQVMASKSNLTLHIKSKHMNIVYQCKQCTYKGTQAGSLRRHMKLQHSVGKHEQLVERYW